MRDVDPAPAGNPTPPLRVVQSTNGFAGSTALRAIAEHPGPEWVGCFAHSPAKVGRGDQRRPTSVLAG
ncbi:MAG TPA: hypothetical protein VND70_10525 [Acidimicrobiales bacterium]|nr:hypothetical protein [Acidimicrobiales bacterium]